MFKDNIKKELDRRTREIHKLLITMTLDKCDHPIYSWFERNGDYYCDLCHEAID